MQVARILAGLVALLCLISSIHQPGGEGRFMSLMACLGALFTLYLCKQQRIA